MSALSDVCHMYLRYSEETGITIKGLPKLISLLMLLNKKLILSTKDISEKWMRE